LKAYNYSFRALKFWLREPELEITTPELIRLLLPERIVRFMKKPMDSAIVSVQEVEDYSKIQFRGLSYPLYYPKKMPLEPLNQVARELFNKNDPHYYEKKITPVEDDIVLDCGAAEGLFGLTILGRARRIFLVEPLPIFQKSLIRTYAGFSSIELLPYALGSSTGQVFFTSDEFAISSRVSEAPSDLIVNQTTIDKLFFDRGEEVTYIKADVEGAEIDLIRGGLKTIKSNKPKIAITTYHSPSHARDIIKMIKGVSSNYKIVTKGYVFNQNNPELNFPVMLHAST